MDWQAPNMAEHMPISPDYAVHVMKQFGDGTVAGAVRDMMTSSSWPPDARRQD